MAGDDEALLALFDRHHHRIYLYCLKMVGNHDEAEDLAQELWLRLLKVRGRREEVRFPISLMLTIARNLCLNSIRMNKRHSPLDDLPESDHPAVTTREMSHLEELVALSLPRLPMAQREVLILHAYCGYTFQDISSMLNVQEGTIRMRASRARAHLGRIISAILAVEEDREQTDNPPSEYEGDPE